MRRGFQLLDLAALLINARDIQRAIGLATLAHGSHADTRTRAHLVEAQRAAARLESVLADAARKRHS